MNLIVSIYKMTTDFPKEEMYGLTSQTKRSAVSIAANIAEGYGRVHRKEYLNHLSIAKGSLLELETHLLIANRINYITKENLIPIWEQTQTVGKLLSGLQKSLAISYTLYPKPYTLYPIPYTLTTSHLKKPIHSNI